MSDARNKCDTDEGPCACGAWHQKDVCIMRGTVLRVGIRGWHHWHEDVREGTHALMPWEDYEDFCTEITRLTKERDEQKRVVATAEKFLRNQGVWDE